MPDTEREDSAAERFWPEGYKQVIREDFRQLAITQLDSRRWLQRTYQQQYVENFPELSQFAGKLADIIAIGAENGADDAFDDIIAAFLTESALPEQRTYARYFWSKAFPQRARERLQQVVDDEYSQDDVYIYAYQVGYHGRCGTFGEFISQIACLVVTGAINGADDALQDTFRSFVTRCPLPPARRHPRRLKTW